MSRWGAILLPLLLTGAACGTGAARSAKPPADPLVGMRSADLFEQGQALAARGDVARAQQYLLAAKEAGMDPDIVVPVLVTTCLRASMWRAALLHGEAHLRGGRKDPDLAFLLGAARLGLKDTAQARRWFAIALESQTLAGHAHYRLAKLERFEGDVRQAKHHLQAIVDEAPSGSLADKAREELASLGSQRPSRRHRSKRGGR